MLSDMKRDTNKYELIDGKKVVYVGITNDLDRRVEEHRADGMHFTGVRKVGIRTTPKIASKWETERIHTYMRNHKGNTPKYNKNSSGK